MIYLIFRSSNIRTSKGRIEIALNASGSSYKCQKLRSSVMLPSVDVDNLSTGEGDNDGGEPDTTLATDGTITVPLALKKCAVVHLQLNALIRRLESEEDFGDDEKSTEIYAEVDESWRKVINGGEELQSPQQYEIGTTVELKGMMTIPCVCSIVNDASNTEDDPNNEDSNAGENHLDALIDSGLVSPSSSPPSAGGVKWLNLFFVLSPTHALFAEKADGSGGKIVSAVNWNDVSVHDSGDGRKLTLIDDSGCNKGRVFDNGKEASVWFEDGKARQEAREKCNDVLGVARVGSAKAIVELLKK